MGIIYVECRNPVCQYANKNRKNISVADLKQKYRKRCHTLLKSILYIYTYLCTHTYTYIHKCAYLLKLSRKQLKNGVPPNGMGICIHIHA